MPELIQNGTTSCLAKCLVHWLIQNYLDFKARKHWSLEWTKRQQPKKHISQLLVLYLQSCLQMSGFQIFQVANDFSIFLWVYYRPREQALLAAAALSSLEVNLDGGEACAMTQFNSLKAKFKETNLSLGDFQQMLGRKIWTGQIFSINCWGKAVFWLSQAFWLIELIVPVGSCQFENIRAAGIWCWKLCCLWAACLWSTSQLLGAF